MATRTKLHDLTATNVPRELELHRAGNPLVDPAFRRHVHAVTTDDQRRQQTDRLRKARRAA